MSFDPGGGGIANANDVALSNPVTGNFLGYVTGVGKWENLNLTGTAAMATGGGVEGLSALGNKTGATTLNLSNANVFSLTMTGNVTFTVTNATASTACSFGLYIFGASGKTVTWPSGTKWANGTAPTLTSNSTDPDILVLETINGGTTWYGSLVGNSFS